MMWAFQNLQRPISSPAIRARTLIINIPLTLEDTAGDGDGGVTAQDDGWGGGAPLQWCSPPLHVSHKAHQEGGQHATYGEDRHRQWPVHGDIIMLSQVGTVFCVGAIDWQVYRPLWPHPQGPRVVLLNDLGKMGERQHLRWNILQKIIMWGLATSSGQNTQHELDMPPWIAVRGNYYHKVCLMCVINILKSDSKII